MTARPPATGRTGLLFLGRDEVGRLLDVAPMLVALEAAFVAFTAGRANVPPRVAARAEGGMLAAMPGYLAGIGLAVKAISVFPANHAAGLPSHQGLIVLFDETTGTPRCVMDAITITALRTAGASAVAVRALARPDARVLAILGSGVQAASHLQVVGGVREFTEIRIAARDRRHAEELARTDRRAVAVESFEAATRAADVVCCCTDASDPVLRYDWLRPGAHVTSVGTGHELDATTVARGRVFVEWRGAAASAPPAGALELQGLDPAAVTELGEVLAGLRPGRTSGDEITVYKSTGHAIEDAAAARLVYDRAVAAGVGQILVP
jgi:ornithine cyclodeaminase/alanine dehydrogenase-like protein (mu-crystallin family)